MFGSYADALLPGVHVVEGGQTSTGSIVAWLRRELLGGGGSGEGCGGGGVDYATLNAEAAAVPPGCEGLTALDHFQARAAARATPAARAGGAIGCARAHRAPRTRRP